MSGLKAMKLPQDRIDQVFARCRDTKGSKNVATFICTAKTFWRTLSNSLSLVDLSGIWTIAVSSGDDEALDAKLFLDFFCGVARLKYPYLSKNDCCEMLLRDLDIETSLPESLNSSIFEMAVDRSAIHELFKCESELKKAFVMFTNDRCDNLDGGNTWEAVGRLSLTIEVGQNVF